MIQILTGDCREVMKTLPSESVQCCVTSPPYWGLRDYGTATWEGGSAECDHVADASKTKKFGNAAFNENRPSREATKVTGYYFDKECGKCGAKRIDSQIGLETTPQAYVETMVGVFAEVWRVLRPDGTLWLNLGDSYAANRGGTTPPAETLAGGIGGTGDDESKRGRKNGHNPSRDPSCHGLKHKDLVGIPWRVAFALQEAGWYLRQDIIWHKPSTMPESVTDRCTKAHEYIFLLTKNARYYYDNEAIKEPSEYPDDDRKGRSYDHHKSAPTKERAGVRPGNYLDGGRGGYATRNKRSVWSVTNFGYRDAHFATYPPDLIKPCIMAGSKPGDTILDPFGGSGTTGEVALGLGRNAILIELNPAYAALAETRTNVTMGLAL